MVKITIYWTQTALKQRNHTFNYWNKRSKSNTYSKKLNTAIKERINLLKKHPEMGKPTDYKLTRAISLGHYSILYLIHDSKIIITGFWDNRQDPKKLLKHLRDK